MEVTVVDVVVVDVEVVGVVVLAVVEVIVVDVEVIVVGVVVFGMLEVVVHPLLIWTKANKNRKRNIIIQWHKDSIVYYKNLLIYTFYFAFSDTKHFIDLFKMHRVFS